MRLMTAMDWTEGSFTPNGMAFPLQQHPFYAATCRAFGADVCSYFCGPADAPLGAAVVTFRRFPLLGTVAHIARGPVWYAAATPLETCLRMDLLVRALRKKARVVLASPDPLNGADALRASGLLPAVTPATMAHLSLQGTAPDRMARQQAKWRNRLRRALDLPLKVRSMPMPVETDHWLLREEAAQAKAKGYKGLPPSFAHAWRVTNGPASARLFVARLKGEDVAAMLFLKHGGQATYQIGWSSPQGRAAHAHNLLLWEAANWFASRGVEGIDLGTLDTANAPGLARFKLGAGTQPLVLGTTYLDAPLTAPFARIARMMAKAPRSQTGPGSAPQAEALPPQPPSADPVARPQA